MSLNIKNPRVHALAREAARRGGTTQTGAMERALEQYLESLQNDAERAARVDALIDEMSVAIAKGPGPLSTEDLYGEDGLPV
ncbi:type II toxin-antitoxin system VapB family antitoxin [Nesterenkonia sp. MY13]|uniref:Type II toxin-antitoxin system VapB family antitoxin n=1 Tax=Nesterenkonia sedimenti TaxID=1463632 RepID=A0A7X8TIL3_9MICC|nr:type II toxin-antitoxin system VapB family antitoxin [Nesterenkonia sedimenti]NLS09211.1 type II toxin-antitoxin system VapB family antitoxin [Nesterenkonia sedimenti]